MRGDRGDSPGRNRIPPVAVRTLSLLTRFRGLRGSQTESQRRTGPYARAAHCSDVHFSAEAPAACIPIADLAQTVAVGGHGSYGVQIVLIASEDPPGAVVNVAMT
jgi:hypothetical protein